MGSLSTNFTNYISEISRIGGDLAPMVFKGLLLLLLLLILVKYLAQFLTPLLIKFGLSDRKAAYSVTGLHILVLIFGTLLVLSLVGFPGEFLVRTFMVVILSVIVIYVIAKPYIPQLPFQIGDIITTAVGTGTVDKISITRTGIRTFDGNIIYIPNHKILNDAITNSSVRPNRRLDINFFIHYNEDVKKIKQLVLEIFEQNEIVLEKPAPRVVIDQFNPDYMTMKARFWVQRKNALTGRWGLNEEIKSRFEEAGVSMASSKMEVTLSGQGH